MAHPFPARIPPCPFCDRDSIHIIDRESTVFAIKDSSPVTRHHMLIIPVRHCIDYFELTQEERIDCHILIKRLKERIQRTDPQVTGFNIGTNCGKTAGQTVFHTHIHLIPRRENDTPDPRGGVRGVIPGKMNY